jgi:predicted metallo-beta-lactamase superfamily hydrolase
MKILKKIKVIPLAFESMGVRSMCTYIETPDIKVQLDPGISLGTNRFGLAPHPQEYKMLKKRREIILKYAKKTDVVTVSHYHFDHHTPSYLDWACNWSSPQTAEKIYKGKIVLVKSYKSLVNSSQRRRGWIFSKTSGPFSEKLETADGKSFKFKKTIISFSKPVFHGPFKSELGYVLMMTLQYEEEKILFAPDIQGPMCKETLTQILFEKPELAIIGGPPVYLEGFRISTNQIRFALDNLKIIVKKIPITILDHHLLRDINWKEKTRKVYNDALSKGHKVLTAAEFIGEKNNLLESQRKVLYEREPPTEEFIKWTKIPFQNRKNIRPPI